MKEECSPAPVQHALGEGMKKALTEMLILYTLSSREHYIQEIIESIARKSGGVLHIVFPYASLYRLMDDGYVEELKKRNAPDGRRRQYYAITPSGQEHLNALLVAYRNIQAGLNSILNEGGHNYDETGEAL